MIVQSEINPRPAALYDVATSWDLLLALAEATRPAWMRDGLCREHPEVSFHPGRGESATAAKAICARCLARQDCLAWAVETGEQDGIWGGLSGPERRRLTSTAEDDAEAVAATV